MCSVSFVFGGLAANMINICFELLREKKLALFGFLHIFVFTLNHFLQLGDLIKDLHSHVLVVFEVVLMSQDKRLPICLQPINNTLQLCIFLL